MDTRLENHEETLGEFLASRARDASESRLAGDVVAAVLTGVAIAFWRGPLWDVRIGIAVCFFAFGLWGIADRDLNRLLAPSRARLRTLKVARIVAATVGFVGAGYVLMSLLGRAIGRVIS